MKNDNSLSFYNKPLTLNTEGTTPCVDKPIWECGRNQAVDYICDEIRGNVYRLIKAIEAHATDEVIKMEVDKLKNWTGNMQKVVGSRLKKDTFEFEGSKLTVKNNFEKDK